MSEKRLTAEDVASRLDVSLSTVHRWKRVGYLPSPTKRPGKPVVWSESSIRKWEKWFKGVHVWPPADKVKLTVDRRYKPRKPGGKP